MEYIYMRIPVPTVGQWSIDL